jgi:hypothetical protein
MRNEHARTSKMGGENRTKEKIGYFGKKTGTDSQKSGFQSKSTG